MNIKTKSTLEKLQNKLRFRNYSKQTIRTYSSYAEKFLLSFDKDVYHISVKEAREYLESYPYTSISQQNQIISSIKFLYRNVVGSKLTNLKITRPRKEKKLPRIIEHDYIVQKLSEIDNLKHKAILSLTYSAALRVSEIINLKIEDIDSKRMLIHIINAKGKKDRYVKLSEKILILLRKYYKEYHPKEYLFNGQFKNQYSRSSINKLVKKYIGEKYHTHLLRHSGASQAYENGTDIFLIQKLLGHSKPETTQIYTHVTNKTLQKIKLAI